MKYEEMLRIMDEYLNSDDLKNQDWIEIIQTSKQHIQKELNTQNDIK